jgi:HAD superfamily hydrolase (TIGR01484 family)
MALAFRRGFREKQLIVFDLDGTLTESKAALKSDMSSLLVQLLIKQPVAVIGGGRYEQFRKQFVAKLKVPRPLLKKLFLFPTSSTSFYRYSGGWRKVYREDLSPAEKKEICAAFQNAFARARYVNPKRTWGVLIEDRGTQITFSALGQKAPIPAKEAWNRKYNKVRMRLARLLRASLPRFEVRTGGLTSIDVTRKGIDKAYGIRQMEKHLGIPRRDMLFVGDAIYPGGNDYAVTRTGVDYVQVNGPKQTKKVIRFLISER